MNDQASPMPLGAELRSLRVSCYLRRTRTRVDKMRKLVKNLKLPEPEGLHWMSAAFLAPKPSNLVISLHIDSYDGDGKDPPVRALWIELFIRKQPSTKPPADVSARPDSDWLIEELSELAMKEPKFLGFFDADVHIPPDAQVQPADVGAIPLTVGSRTLPVVGVEYGGKPEAGTMDSFRWTRDLRDPPGLRVRMSYSRRTDVAELSEIWAEEHARIGSFVQEALTR